MSYEDEDTFTASDFYGDSAPAAESEVQEGAPEPEEDEGQGAAEDEGTPEGAAPAPTYFDPTAFTDHLVKVKVDGEEVEVPVAEMVQGYQRQADYTRKTQEVAAQREQLAYWQQVQAAMQADPTATLEYLQRQFGAAAPAAEDDDWGYDDPVKRELAELRQTTSQAVSYMQEKQAEERLQQVLGGLSSKYGEEFDAQEVITEAVKRGIQDIGAIEPLFKEMAFEKYRAQTSAQREVAAKTAATEAQRRTAAAAAAKVVGTGGSSNRNAASAAPAPRRNLTVQEAYQLAKVELSA